MMFTTEMVHLTAVVMKDRSELVAKSLLDLGVVQFNRLADVEPDLSSRLHEASVDERWTAVAETRTRVEHLLRMGGLEPPRTIASAGDASEKPAPVADVELDEVNARLDRLAKEVERYRGRQAELQRQINRLSDVWRALAAVGEGGAVAGLGRIREEQHRFLDVRYGRLPADRFERADREVGRLSGLVLSVGTGGGEERVVVVAMKRNASEVGDALEAAGFRREDLPAAPELGGVNALEEADERIARLESEQSEQSARIASTISDRRDALEREWRDLRVVELLLSIRRESSESSHAAVFSGWVPARSRERAEEAVRSAADGACYLEWHTAAEVRAATGSRMQVPVELRNPRFLKPFQMLVTNYGVPEYGTVDPTPLVAIAYLLMFGLMFGDAGHGLVLVVLGLVGSRLLSTRGMRQLSKLLTWCGGASIAMGVLFGAYFGYALLPPLWFDYHGVVAGHPGGGAVNNLLDILTMTVYFGVAVIGAGLVLNWVNRIRRRDWFELVFSKEGIFGGVIYAAGVWVAAGFARTGFEALPDLSVAGPVILVAAAALFFRFPLEAARARGAGLRPVSPAMWVMGWVIELLEIFSGYLANTLSFMRVAGLGIAHVMLMVAFFQIARMISPSGASIGSIVVLVAGNALVIALEGLSAGIQSLRLNYYEFFSRYFVPTGSEYRPISLHTRSQGG